MGQYILVLLALTSLHVLFAIVAASIEIRRQMRNY